MRTMRQQARPQVRLLLMRDVNAEGVEPSGCEGCGGRGWDGGGDSGRVVSSDKFVPGLVLCICEVLL